VPDGGGQACGPRCREFYTSPEREAELLQVIGQLRAIEQEGSGLLQTLVLRSQTDPTEVFVVVVFESDSQPELLGVRPSLARTRPLTGLPGRSTRLRCPHDVLGRV